uniref:Uncharacterized protein n=1 Tax=Dulem virus 33 TaxID=3145751 RepID=A0AAU8B5R4_9CAUD
MQTAIAFIGLIALICTIVFAVKSIRKRGRHPKQIFFVSLAVFIVCLILTPSSETNERVNDGTSSEGVIESASAETPEISELLPSADVSEPVNTSEPPNIEPTDDPDTQVSVMPPITSREPGYSPSLESVAPSKEVETPEPSPSSDVPVEATETIIHGKPSSTTVYVSDRSHTIHSVSDCSGMKNYTEMTLGDADSKGYNYCPNCW